MRIALFHNLPSGGAKRALHEWAKMLSLAHSIEVFSLSTADHAFLDIRPYARAYQVFDFAPHRLLRPPLGRLNQLQYWRNLGDLDRIASQMGRIINEGGYDVAFLNPCEYTYMPALASHLRIPSMYYLHEPFGPSFQRRIPRPYLTREGLRSRLGRLSPLRAMYTSRLEAIRRQGISQVNSLVSNSEYTRNQIEAAYGASSVVCYYGVNSDTFRPLPAVEKEHSVISVGAMTPRKGFDFLIRSLAEIPSAARPLLRIASNGAIPEELAYIRNLAVELDVQTQLLTNLDSQELCFQYNKARLCVYSPVMEPFGLVPLEAMACGTPVVGVAEGGVRESVVHGSTGLLTDRDPALFAAAVRELLADPVRLITYGAQARDYVLESWTWANSAAKLEQLLVQTAGAHAARRNSV